VRVASLEDLRAARKVFDGRRLTLARTFRGLRKNELAQLLGVTPAAVGQFENGHTRPSPETLAQLTLAVGFPLGFFETGRPSFPVSEERFQFRSLKAATKLARVRVLARVELLAELVSMLEAYVELPPVDLPNVSTTDLESGDMNAITSRLRLEAALGLGPLDNAVGFLELRGCIVTRLRAETREVDAFSGWVGQRPFVVLSADKSDTARSRFDAAHELGHLLLHHDVDSDNEELEFQAHAFASAFLMPKESLLRELPRRLDWGRLIELKLRWRVSLAALLRRARDLGALSEFTYRRAMVQMSSWGWRVNEPGEVGAAEQPTLLHDSLLLLERGLGISSDDVCEALRVSPRDLELLVGESPVRLRLEPSSTANAS